MKKPPCKRHKWGLCLLGDGDKTCVSTCTVCGETKRKGQHYSDQELARREKNKGKAK